MGKTLEIMQPFTRALNKSHLIAAGFSYDDLQKPIIAVANSWNEFNHGHVQHKALAEWVKAGIRVRRRAANRIPYPRSVRRAGGWQPRDAFHPAARGS